MFPTCHCTRWEWTLLARYYAALVDGGVVPPPHFSSLKSPLGSHARIPDSSSENSPKEQKYYEQNQSRNINTATKIFSNSGRRINDAFMGAGEYGNLILPDGTFGLGFKGFSSEDGSLIGFGHSGVGGSTGFCDVRHRFAIAVIVNKLSFGAVTANIVQLVCSELNIPLPDQYARFVVVRKPLIN